MRWISDAPWGNHQCKPITRLTDHETGIAHVHGLTISRVMCFWHNQCLYGRCTRAVWTMLFPKHNSRIGWESSMGFPLIGWAATEAKHWREGLREMGGRHRKNSSHGPLPQRVHTPPFQEAHLPVKIPNTHLLTGHQYLPQQATTKNLDVTVNWVSAHASHKTSHRQKMPWWIGPLAQSELMAPGTGQARETTVSSQDGRLGATAGQKKDKSYLLLMGWGEEGEKQEVGGKRLWSQLWMDESPRTSPAFSMSINNPRCCHFI